jgi:penicillin-binding protein 1A
MDLRMQKAAEETTQKHWAAFDENYAEQRLMALLKIQKNHSPEFLDRWRKWKADPKTAEEPDDVEEPVPVQGALVCIDPHTGGVRALVGGRNFQESQFNRATQAKRQPGSTFKPFVWQAALDSGLTAATVVDDWPIAYTDMEHNPRLVAEATDYAVLKEMVTDYYKVPRAPDAPDPIWAPQNWDNKFLGPITLRRGFALSRNLVSVRLIDRVGPAAVAKTARQAGISSPLEAVLSLGLGSSVVTPLELVSAVGTYANAGVHMRPFMVTRVVDRTGNVLEENVIQGSPGPSPQSAYLVTRLMQAVVQEGTAGYARNLGRPAAGKTGTTQDMRDLWFVGFVPDLVTGVWLGYDDFTPLGKKLTSSGTTVPIWTDFMAEAAKYVPTGISPCRPASCSRKLTGTPAFWLCPPAPTSSWKGSARDWRPRCFVPPTTTRKNRPWTKTSRNNYP